VKSLFKVILFVLLIPCQVCAQQAYKISGTVRASGGELVPQAEIYLLNSKDSALIKFFVLTDGKFLFGDITAGDYVLKTICFGYMDKYQQIHLNADVDVVVSLEPKIGVDLKNCPEAWYST
jgi:hypothetical protein